MKIRITPRRARWFGAIGIIFLRALGATWRFRMKEDEAFCPEQKSLFACLHGDMLLPVVFYRKKSMVALVSEYGDGEVIARIAKGVGGFIPVRGSSTRGGAKAFLEMIKRFRGNHWVITPDGPRGPRGSVQGGVIQMAAKSGRPIWPLGFAVSRAKRFNSWDRFVLPAPFARIAGVVGEPLKVPPRIDREERRRLADDLERRLADAHEQAAKQLMNW